MSILVVMLVGLQALARPAPDLVCANLVPIARAAMAEALRGQGAASPVPWLDDDRVWVAGLDERDATRCVLAWGGNPTGGGYHGAVAVDLASGRVVEVTTGRHLR